MPYCMHVYVAGAVVTVGFVGSVYTAYRVYQNLKQVKLPEEWNYAGTLTDLYLYPIKSCGPVVLDKAECTTLGLKLGWLRDKILMVMDENNIFITARKYPELFKVQPSMEDSILTVKHENMEPLRVNLAEVVELRKPVKAEIWSIPVSVYDCGWAAKDWFSRLLDKSTNKFRLAYYASNKGRGIMQMLKPYNFTKDDTGAFPDEASFHFINEASVDELNTRLKNHKVTHRNFRPNFVLKGPAGAFAEDKWKFIKIGNNVFEVKKFCTRCLITTIDPETGTRNNDLEPLTTLRTYRLVEDPEERKAYGNAPRMGVMMTLRSGNGYVSVNDSIYYA